MTCSNIWPIIYSLQASIIQKYDLSSALTIDRTEAPALVFGVVKGGGAPHVSVFAADAGAAVEPLSIVQEGQETGAAMGVTLDGVDLCRKDTNFKFQFTEAQVLYKFY